MESINGTNSNDCDDHRVPDVDAVKGSTARDALKVPRHSWKYKIKVQVVNGTGGSGLDYPFLHDNNAQDYMFSNALLVDAPFAQVDKNAWADFAEKLVLVTDKNGEYPFLHLKEGSAKSRFNEYKKIVDIYSDKNGPGIDLDDWNVDNNRRDKIDDGKEYQTKIYQGIVNVIDEYDSLVQEKEAKAAQSKADQELEASCVEQIKSRALGKIMNPNLFEIPSSSSSDREMNYPL
jgi:hypothetical protein